MNQIRLPFVIHWPDTPKPDLSTFTEPVRVPFRWVRRPSSDDAPPDAGRQNERDTGF